MTSVYELQEVGFSYGDRRVLSVDELSIEHGSVVALVGPNGTGKTTLLHLLAFVESPSEGRIRFFGKDYTPETRIELRRRVGLLLQQPYLFHSTVIANVARGLRIRGISRAESRRRAEQALEMVGLRGFAGRHARSLSGGEAQRVALARALAPDPEVLLLDEPANNLDRSALERTEQVVAELSRDRGKTIIFTSHNVGSWRSLTHRVLHMVRGKPVDASLDNLFKGTLGPDGRTFDTGRVIARAPEPVPNADMLSIAPDKVEISRSQSGRAGDNMFPGRIVSLTENEDCVIVGVKAGELFRAQVRHDSWKRMGLGLGDDVVIHLPADAMTFIR